MTIVEPPFLLDFGGADLDHRVDFPEEVMIEWHEEKREEFGERSSIVKRVLTRRNPWASTSAIFIRAI
jgi:hypothetical protein